MQHIFGRVYEEYGIEHRLTKIKHPWTSVQVERMNPTIKKATLKRLPYDDHAQLRQHLRTSLTPTTSAQVEDFEGSDAL